MGTRSLPLISFPPLPPPLPFTNPNFACVYRRPVFSFDLPANSGTSVAPCAQRDSEAETTRRERFGSGSEFDFAGDVDGRYGSRSREKRRKWWPDEDEDDDDDDDGDEDLFGFWKEPRTTDLLLKVLGTVGWIMPNILMSSMLDTGDKGQDALFMALMLPLGQFAISLVVDGIQGNPRPKRKKKRFGKTASRTRRGNKTRRRSYRTSQERAGYHPWWDVDISFSKNGAKSGSKFGGWDELDQQVDHVGDMHGLPAKKDENSKKDSKVQID